MSEEYPLYPELSEQGKIEAQQLMDVFKKEIVKLVSDVMSDVYCNIIPHIESDSWANYGNKILSGFMGYRQDVHKHNYAELRKAIYRNHKDAIDKDLNQDLVEENKRLIETIKIMQKRMNSYE
jgi:hypothetical protein